jgi:hypothetical protein
MSRPPFCSSPWLRFPLAAAAAFALGACGSDETTPAASGGGTTSGDASSTADGNGSVAIGAVDKLALSVAVKHLDQQLALQGAVLKPQGCTDKAPCPLMVVVGDYDSNAYPEYVPGLTKLAGALKIGVVVFNLPGMGPGSNKSEGIDEYGSGAQAAAVKEVMLLKSAASWVDKSRCGFLTIGTGLIATTKALATYGNTDALKNTLFLLDVEGPLDRCSISQAPANEADGIVSDGPGATDSTCHFSKTGSHAVTYPPATGSLPASIVCSPAAWPITKTGKGCDENSWWVDREPYNYLKKAFYRYQRIQFEHDHRLPSKWASRLAIQALASSPSKFWQINNMQACTAAWSDEECVGMPCWIQGSWGNGLGPSPYAAGKLVKITNEALFTQVLPGYVQRLIDVQANPPCK